MEGSDNFKVLVQQEDFDLSSELALLRQDNNQVGAIVSFVGLVRDINDGLGVSCLELEHYPGMTERCLKDIVLQAAERWTLLGATVIHRIGRLSPADQIVLVAVSSLHRGESFAACEFIMDYLKTRAPFWKKELTSSGERWVDARSSDHSATKRWES